MTEGELTRFFCVMWRKLKKPLFSSEILTIEKKLNFVAVAIFAYMYNTQLWHLKGYQIWYKRLLGHI